VKILGPAEIVYRPDKPLSCGARVWVETQSQVQPLGLDGSPLHPQRLDSEDR